MDDINLADLRKGQMHSEKVFYKVCCTVCSFRHKMKISRRTRLNVEKPYCNFVTASKDITQFYPENL
jgi:hypothetical protein